MAPSSDFNAGGRSDQRFPPMTISLHQHHQMEHIKGRSKYQVALLGISVFAASGDFLTGGGRMEGLGSIWRPGGAAAGGTRPREAREATQIAFHCLPGPQVSRNLPYKPKSQIPRSEGKYDISIV